MAGSKAKRILFIVETKDLTDKLLKSTFRKQAKGLIRLGHDVQIFSYNHALHYISPLNKMRWMRRFYWDRVEDLMAVQIRNYNPEIILMGFFRGVDADTVRRIRQAAPGAILMGFDGDLWPERHEGRMEAAALLDCILTTYAGKGTAAYRDNGVKCVFLPNACDPDIERRYDVSDAWKSDILFTGQERMRPDRYPTEDTRFRILQTLATMKNCTLYGCCNRPRIGGIEYFYAISGAKIGLSVNAVNDIRLGHSDRFITYLSCGTLVLAKRVPDSDLLFRDGIHLRYFDEVEEFFELAKWYLAREEERLRIAGAGMEHAHAEFSVERIAGWIVDIAEKGSYDAPWMRE